MWTLLAAGLQQQLGDGRVVCHDGDVERREALAVGGVQVQLLGRELVQKDLHCVQVLLLHGLEDTVAALHRLEEETGAHSHMILHTNSIQITFVLTLVLASSAQLSHSACGVSF